MDNKNKILIIAAHPDDEVLGCGGTIAKYSKDREVYVLILGEGVSSRYQKKEEAPREELDKIKEQSRKASQVLGVKESFFLDLPDQRFDTVSFLDIVKKIENIIQTLRPEVIYTHSSRDLNLDHRITFEAVLTATRPTGDFLVKELYSFEVLSSTEWSFQKVNGSFSPNFFEEISFLDISKKIESLKIYEGEIRKFPHPRSEEAILSLAKTRGSSVGLNYAEAFELIRCLK